MKETVAILRQFVVVLAIVLTLGILGGAYAKGEGWLGVMLQPLNDDLREAMNIGKDVTGVLVGDVMEDSPAEAAGIEKGDVIIEIDGTAITSADDAITKVKSFAPGDNAKIVVLRDGGKEVVTAVLGERETAEKEIADKDVAEEQAPEVEDYYNLKIPRMERIFRDFRPGPGGYLGVRVQDISSDLGQYFGVGEGEGVLVLEVTDDSPAQKAGLKAGDVIIKVDGKDVTSSGELVRYMRESKPGEKVDVTLKRSRETRRIGVELGEAPDVSRIFINEIGNPGEFRGPRCMPERGKRVESFRRMRPGELRGPCCMPEKGNLEKSFRMMRPGEPGRDLRKEMRDDIRQEINDLKKEIEKMREEIEALRKS